MNAAQRRLVRKNLESRLAQLRHLELAPVPRGWIRALRESLGMTVPTKFSSSDTSVLPQ
jgi:hypothetical protein